MTVYVKNVYRLTGGVIALPNTGSAIFPAGPLPFYTQHSRLRDITSSRNSINCGHISPVDKQMYNMCYKTVLNFKQMSCSAHTGPHLHMQASCRALQLLGECNALWGEREQARFMFVCTLLYTLLINPPAHISAAKCYSVRLSFTVTLVICYVINPRRACAARVTVVVLCVCLSVCLFVCQQLFSHYRPRGGL